MGVLKNTPYPSAQRDTRELVSDVFMRINGGVPFWTSFDTIASCRRLEAGCKNIGTWEKFIVEKIANNEYAFYSLSNGKYVQANLNDGGKLYATSETVAGAWESFKVTKIK